MSIIGLIVALLIVCLCWWAVTALLGAFGVGDPIATVVKVIFVVIVILYLLSAFGLGPNVGTLRLR
jgi:uncharacterized membrane protein YwzB